MESLKERILQDGKALSETVLKVDSFLNHGVDAKLMYEIGSCFKEYYLRLACNVAATDSRLASNAVVSSLFDEVSACLSSIFFIIFDPL